MTSSAPSTKKLVVFLGGSSGLGFAALESLLATGGSYHIVLGSRTPLEAWRHGQLQPSLASSRSTLDRYECDLARYESVRQFAATVIARHSEPIDALVLSAGMISFSHRLTADKEDEMLQVNVLTEALLIDLLEPKLGQGGARSRILLVGSSLHRQVSPGTVDPKNIENIVTRNFAPMEVYHITKLIQIYLLYMVHARFETSKPSITVVVVSPGFVPDTGLSRELGLIKHGIMHFVMPRSPFATTIPDAGRTICRGITQDFPSGAYFSQRKVEETSEETYDLDLRAQWSQWFISKNVWHPAEKPVATATATASAPAPAVQTPVVQTLPTLTPVIKPEAQVALSANVPGAQSMAKPGAQTAVPATESTGSFTATTAGPATTASAPSASE